MFVAARTTELARLKLLRKLEILRQFPGCKLLYCDTDSIIFRYRRDQKNAIFKALEIGECLGKLKIEKPEYDILEYVGAGKSICLSV